MTTAIVRRNCSPSRCVRHERVVARQRRPSARERAVSSGPQSGTCGIGVAAPATRPSYDLTTRICAGFRWPAVGLVWCKSRRRSAWRTWMDSTERAKLADHLRSLFGAFSEPWRPRMSAVSALPGSRASRRSKECEKKRRRLVARDRYRFSPHDANLRYFLRSSRVR